jgi:S-adenosylmethionine hydrolase
VSLRIVYAIFLLGLVSIGPGCGGQVSDMSENVMYQNGEIRCRIVKVGVEFGNLHTDLTRVDLDRLKMQPDEKFRITFKDQTVHPILGTTYGDVPRGDWVAFLSTEGPEKGTLEIARNFANASEALGCKTGDILTISTMPESP